MLVENISVGEKKNEKKDNIEAVKNSRMFYYFHIYMGKPVFIASYFHMKFMHSL